MKVQVWGQIYFARALEIYPTTYISQWIQANEVDGKEEERQSRTNNKTYDGKRKKDWITQKEHKIISSSSSSSIICRVDAFIFIFIHSHFFVSSGWAFHFIYFKLPYQLVSTSDMAICNKIPIPHYMRVELDMDMTMNENVCSWSGWKENTKWIKDLAEEWRKMHSDSFRCQR